MKHTFLLTIAVIITLSACQKQKTDETTETPSNLRTSGFFCTLGINSIDVNDTLCLRASVSSGTFTITDYSSTAEAGGFIVRPRDIWTLITTGDNNWHLKNNAGKYISFEDDPYATNDEYSYDLDDVPNEKSVFIRSETSGQNFYLESKYKRGYFLMTRAANVAPPDPSHRSVRFQKNKQLWFFMP